MYWDANLHTVCWSHLASPGDSLSWASLPGGAFSDAELKLTMVEIHTEEIRKLPNSRLLPTPDNQLLHL